MGALMKIVAAFSDLEELKMLIDHNVDEVYCGLLKSTELPTMNHRPNNKNMSLENLEELHKAVKIAHQNNKKISLVVNEVGCIYTSLKDFLKKLKKIESLGVDNFVVSDIVLIEALRRAKGNLKINANLTLSSVLPCFNTRTAQYVKKRGISRIVTPQHLYPGELKKIKQNTTIETEVFFYGTNYCRNIDGFCFYTYNKQLWKGEIPLDACDKIANAKMFTKNKAHKWKAKSVFHNPIHQDMFGAVYDYYHAGAEFLKLGNREATISSKRKSIRMAKHMTNKIKTNHSRKEFVNSCRLKALQLLY